LPAARTAHPGLIPDQRLSPILGELGPLGQTEISCPDFAWR